MVIGDISWLPREHAIDLARGHHARAHLAELEAIRIQTVARRLERAIAIQNATKEASDEWGTRHVDGLGQKTLCIAPDLLDEFRAARGVDCLKDDDFRNWLLRNLPALRVRSIPSKVTLLMPGLASCGRLEAHRQGDKEGTARGNNDAASSVAAPVRVGDNLPGRIAPVTSGMKKPRAVILT